jgi:DNA-binding response OmpR family regulator
MSMAREPSARSALVLGKASLVDAVSERLTALGHAACVRARPLAGADFGLVVLCCDGASDWGLYVAHQRVTGHLLPVFVVGHEAPCAQCDAALLGGADAWLPERPAPLLESLLGRMIHAVSRRASGPWVASCSGVRFEPDGFTVWFGTHRFALRPKEYLLLAYLANRAGSWVSEHGLRTEALGILQKHETPIVRVHLSALRKALGAFAGCLESRRGLGYRFLMSNQAAAPPASSVAGA